MGKPEDLGMWPAPAAGEGKEMSIQGVTMSIVGSAYDQVFYIVAHPANADLRVAIRDSIGLALEESRQRPDELKGVLEGMLSGFSFLER